MSYDSLLSSFKKFASHFHPILDSRQSTYNGTLLVGYVNGKKILNTQNANYSFGSLHRIMRFALAEVSCPETEDILLLGLGGGSVISILKDDLQRTNHIVAVDFDPIVIEVAREDFGLDRHANTEVISMDAASFMENTSKTFGLIIIDLFINNVVPRAFFQEAFWQDIIRSTIPRGKIVFNLIAKTLDQALLDQVTEQLQQAGFSIAIHHRIETTNTLMIAKLR